MFRTRLLSGILLVVIAVADFVGGGARSSLVWCVGCSVGFSDASHARLVGRVGGISRVAGAVGCV